jgi:hypothetical protein
MDVQTIDAQYQQLQGISQQTIQELQGLASKMQAAVQAGDQQARDWLLDLRSIALSFKSEQDQMSNLLQALHGFVANQPQYQPPMPQQQVWAQPPAQPVFQQPVVQQPVFQQPAYPQQPPAQAGGVGGMLGGFLNSSFGRAIETGAGFGIGDDLIKAIF